LGSSYQAKLGGKMKLSRISFLLLLLFLLVPSESFAQNLANKSWNTFWQSFQTAVKNRNKATLKSMMSKESFVADGGLMSSSSERNSFINGIGSKEWKMMDAAIKKGIKVMDNTGKATKGELLIFRFENGKWYWSESWFYGD
jgi:hypothetical protein